MAARGKFVRNPKVIREILETDPGVGAALDEVADPVAASAGGTVERRVTDRQARIVVVKAEDQAKDGVATKALGEQGLTLT
jgi:hypothetical protein